MLLPNNIERAVLFRETKEISELNGYDRAYIGSEYCINKLDPHKLAIILKRLPKNINITLMTPIVPENSISIIEECLQILKKNSRHAEVVFNDWGVFELLKGKNLEPVAGRLINKQKRDPRLKNSGNFPKKIYEQFRSTTYHNPAFLKFLKENKICRVELDNVFQGFKEVPCLNASLHYPNVFITNSRKCIDHNMQYTLKKNCKRECLNNKYKLEKGIFPVPVYIDGNTQYYVNETLPKSFKGINRLVYNA